MCPCKLFRVIFMGEAGTSNGVKVGSYPTGIST